MEQNKQLVTSTNRSKINSDKVNLSVSISKIKKNTHELQKMYDFKKYMDSSDMNFPEEMDEMIPKDTPRLIWIMENIMWKELEEL